MATLVVATSLCWLQLYWDVASRIVDDYYQCRKTSKCISVVCACYRFCFHDGCFVLQGWRLIQPLLFTTLAILVESLSRMYSDSVAVDRKVGVLLECRIAPVVVLHDLPTHVLCV